MIEHENKNVLPRPSQATMNEHFATLYTLKTSENQRLLDFFRGYRVGKLSFLDVCGSPG